MTWLSLEKDQITSFILTWTWSRNPTTGVFQPPTSLLNVLCTPCEEWKAFSPMSCSITFTFDTLVTGNLADGLNQSHLRAYIFFRFAD